MDHRECSRRIDHLEDELDYNFGRKEELKAETRKLKEKYDDLHEIHLKNAQVAMDRNVENAQLKKKIETLQKEISESGDQIESLKSENKILKEQLEFRGKEDESIFNCLKSENRDLKETIGIMKKDKQDIHNDLNTANLNLKLQVENLLTCDECEKSFCDKDAMFSHVKFNHLVRSTVCFKCDVCDDGFATENDMNRHVRTKHRNKLLRKNLLEKMNKLDNQIKSQKITIYNDIFKLKQKEFI